jgi:hypothetical protein
MKHTKLVLAIAATLTATASFSALAMDLYVDSKTKQVFTVPGKGRVLLNDAANAKSDHTPFVPAPYVVPTAAADLDAIKKDLELKQNEIKALEEHVVANKEGNAKNDEKWFNKISVRGYTQLRYNQPISGDHTAGDPELITPGDSGGVKDNAGFSFRRVRLVFSGDINEHVSLYLQPDFATSVKGSGVDDSNNFVQLRDAYADLSYDKKHEYRIRAGQSKVPFGWENLQSSQNRLALDRNDALNSAVPSERDLGLFAYWSPEHVQKLWKNMTKKGLKTSGDYGIVGVGVYNGQGLNRSETNDDLYTVVHTTYPVELNFLGGMFKGQVLEVGADAISGSFTPTVGAASVFGRSSGIKLNAAASGTTAAVHGVSAKNITEERVALHAILFPQPFGLQAEWNWGTGATLNPTANGGNGAIERKELAGGYVQASYKIDNVFRADGYLQPYLKWQTYRGAWKAALNSPMTSVDEVEAGVEYQFNKALELTLAYSMMDRTNTKNLGQASADMGRAQLQWNY